MVLKTYTGERMDLVGEAEVEVRYHEQRRQFPLVITAGSGPAVLGQDWLRQIQLDWKTIVPASVNKNSMDTLEEVCMNLYFLMS